MLGGAFVNVSKTLPLKTASRKLFFSVLITYLLLIVVTLSLLVFGYFTSIRQSQ